MQAIIAIATLLVGIAIILIGNGLLGTLLGVRGGLEGFSSAMLGLIMGVYFAGYVAGTLVVPGMIRQVGHIRIFTALASIASIATLTHGLVVHPVSWMLGRAVTGFCIVGMYIAIESWLNSKTANDSRGHVFSAYMTTTLLGLGLGQVLLLAGDVDTLFLFALASVLLSLGLVPVALTRVREPVIEDVERLGLRKLYEVSPSGVIGSLFAGLGTGALWGLGPVFASGIGLGTRGIAGFMGLTILGGILMMWPVGKLSDRFDRRLVLMWVCLSSTLAAIAALWLTRIDTGWVLLGGFLYGAVSFSVFSLAVAHTNDHVDYAQMLETTASLQLLWGSGAVVGPILAGFFMQWIGPMAFLPFLAVAALIPAIFTRYRMIVSEPVAAAEQSDYIPQFATSPVALEMYPEQVEEIEETVQDGDDEATPVSEDSTTDRS
ncbi:MFS transporter [Wenzhouxiangella limi]|uniref:MFS transporter n=1 Tax=Wenzhouxiangella limi TaxID=2707351 RepID=A0A845UYW3_9GAMM|nr:MFS transporter [Wenzhouxiangella limi]NDY94266.1 MFS transporter [Wenzhouxiangella limi]